MKKRVGVISLLVACLMFVSYVYLYKTQKVEKAENEYLKTVVFQDQDQDLIPISVNFHSQVELEEDVRNRIDCMKSHDFEKYGLYPVLNENLEVRSVDMKKDTLIVNFNDELYCQDPLNLLECLAYTLTDYAGISQLKIQINDEDVTYLPNSTIPLSVLSKNLGLNNFEETSHLLHETIPVMAYKEKNVLQYSYYIPTTYRICESDCLKTQVQTILNYVQGKIHVLDVKLKDQVLTVELDANVLLDNEKIDRTLEDLIVLSLTSLKDVNDVKIEINNEDVRTQQSSQINFNYIKI